jgi:hypothetical protein
MELAVQLRSLDFFSSFSSMPIRHTVNSNSGADKQWQYMDVEPMNSMLLWPEKPPLSLSNINTNLVKELFLNYSLLVFQCDHSEWKDDIVGAHDSTIQQPTGLQLMITQKLAGGTVLMNSKWILVSGGLVCSQSALDSNADYYNNRSHCTAGLLVNCPRVLRKHQADEGESADDWHSDIVNTLHLLWYRWDTDTLWYRTSALTMNLQHSSSNHRTRHCIHCPAPNPQRQIAAMAGRRSSSCTSSCTRSCQGTAESATWRCHLHCLCRWRV